jgi:hypothetical protein
MPTRSEIQAEVAAIRRHAAVIAIKRKALLTASMIISDDEKDVDSIHTLGGQPMVDLRDARRWLLANGEAGPASPTAKAGRMPRRPRPILVFPAKYARLLQAFVYLRAR